MKLCARRLITLLSGAMRRGPSTGGAAIGLVAAIILTPACVSGGQDATDGAAALAHLAAASAGHPLSPLSAGEAGHTPGAPAHNGYLRGSPGEPDDPATVDHPPGPAIPEEPQPGWSPEAVRAGHARGGTGIPAPERERGASAATTSPGPVEVLPGPSAPDGPEREWAAPHGPVMLASSRHGEEPPADVAGAILDAYTAFWDSYWAAASHPVNPDHPGIGRHSVEPLRSRTVGVLRGRVAEGVALRLPGDHGAGRVVHIEGWDADSAEVLDCFVDTAVLYEVATGRVRNDEHATVVHLALMRRQGGTWRVAEIFEQAIHTGRTDGCILQTNTHWRPAPPGTALASPVGSERDGVAGTSRSPW